MLTDVMLSVITYYCTFCPFHREKSGSCENLIKACISEQYIMTKTFDHCVQIYIC